MVLVYQLRRVRVEPRNRASAEAQMFRCHVCSLQLFMKSQMLRWDMRLERYICLQGLAIWTFTTGRLLLEFNYWVRLLDFQQCDCNDRETILAIYDWNSSQRQCMESRQSVAINTIIQSNQRLYSEGFRVKLVLRVDNDGEI